MKAEVRGRSRKWVVWYEDESGIQTPVAVFDREGVLKGTIEVGAGSDKMVAAHGTFDSLELAQEYARYLGATEITVHRSSTRGESLVKARAARAKGGRG